MAEQDTVFIEERGECLILRLAPPGSKIPVLGETRMESLEEAFRAIKQRPNLRALVITGPGTAGFCAGADISAIEGVTDSNRGRALAERGQKVFSLLESIPCKKIAAIFGPCVGGGCELALACDIRIIYGGDESRIGLPEIKLGILPGFGGTQRLPRLVGLPAALDVILKGKVLGAAEAKKIGLVDHIVPRTSTAEEGVIALEHTACAIGLGTQQITRGRKSLRDRLLTYTKIGRGLVERQVTASIAKETKGAYPAPMAALRVSLLGLSDGRDLGFIAEAQALGELVATPVCKSLVHLFRITELSQKLGKTLQSEVGNARILVIGAGVMGAGIASSFVGRGHDTTLIDSVPEAVNAAEKRVRAYIESRRNLSAEKKAELLKGFHAIAGVVSGGDFDLVIEAIVEDLAVKRQVFADLDQRLPESAVLATNTSSLAVTEISKGLRFPKRMLGMHFFNPVEKMPLVEIIRTSLTDERFMLRIAALTARLGKYPIIVEDVPGFLVNRILAPYLSEAGTLLSEGFQATEIDQAALAFGMPMGPFRLLDEVGLDVAAKVQDILEGAYGDRMRGPRYAEVLVQKNRKGRKSGHGFYLFQGEDVTISPNLCDDLGITPKGDTAGRRNVITERLMLALINEAVRCLDEGVAGNPGAEAAGQIDLGSVMGFGFPAFRGGILWYAQSRGALSLHKSFEEYSSTSPNRLLACEGIKRRAKELKSFYH